MVKGWLCKHEDLVQIPSTHIHSRHGGRTEPQHQSLSGTNCFQSSNLWAPTPILMRNFVTKKIRWEVIDEDTEPSTSGLQHVHTRASVTEYPIREKWQCTDAGEMPIEQGPPHYSSVRIQERCPWCKVLPPHLLCVHVGVLFLQ